MSSTLIDNGNLTSLQLAPGAKLRYMQDGTITGSATYTARLGSIGDGLEIGSAHPYNDLALCSESEVTYNESEAECFSNFIGVWSSAVQKVTTVSSMSAQPTTQSKNWIAGRGGDAPDGYLNQYALFDIYGQFVGFPGDVSGTGPGKTGPNGAGTAYPGPDPYMLGGATTFLQGAATIRISFSTTDQSTLTSSVGNIGSFQMSLTAGLVTYSYDYYAFLCTSVTYEETPLGTSGDGQWLVTEEYMYLPAPGLDPAIYG